MSTVTQLPSGSVRERVSPEEWKMRVDLAACYRLAAKYGWVDLIATHISARVQAPPGQHHFLINPHGYLFQQITASSLVKIDQDGNKVSPSAYAVNPAGFVIHSAIHMLNEEAICVFHSHAVAGMGVSMQEDGLLMASQHAAFFHGNLAYHDIEHMEAGVDGRGILAGDLGQHRAMIMRNHGLLTTGRSVAEAFGIMHILERACAAQIAAQSGGAKVRIMPDRVSAHFAAFYRDMTLRNGELAWPALIRMLDDEDPSYRE
ncbi:MAG: class II aldolase/adducin family protein [Proteobacteria bacterium]|nr:class II aldolase/adducin family protein [Pseudomonadota bacterium]